MQGINRQFFHTRQNGILNIYLDLWFGSPFTFIEVSIIRYSCKELLTYNLIIYFGVVVVVVGRIMKLLFSYMPLLDKCFVWKTKQNAKETPYGSLVNYPS